MPSVASFAGRCFFPLNLTLRFFTSFDCYVLALLIVPKNWESLALPGGVRERTCSIRIALLRRYNLRFHVREDAKDRPHLFQWGPLSQISRIHGGANSRRAAEEWDWSRTIECSVSNKLKKESRLVTYPRVTGE